MGMCKHCAWWDHDKGRNKSGAAVFPARCKYTPDVTTDIVFSAAQKSQYNWDMVMRLIFTSPSAAMMPQDGQNCEAFEKRVNLILTPDML